MFRKLFADWKQRRIDHAYDLGIAYAYEQARLGIDASSEIVEHPTDSAVARAFDDGIRFACHELRYFGPIGS